MPRSASYTTEEDSILLATAGQSADEVNDALIQAGFKARSASSIKQRRHYLKSGQARRDGLGPVSDLMAQRDRLRQEIEALEAQRARRLDQLSSINSALHEELAKVSAEVEQEAQALDAH
jgi:predicted nuclease with TOPRIM domain